MTKLASVLVLAFVLPACYMGRTKEARTTAKIVNVSAVVVGGLLVATHTARDYPDQSDCPRFYCFGDSGTNMLLSGAGIGLAAMGVTGLVANWLIGPEPAPPMQAQAHEPSSAVVTTPGLGPSTIQLR